jgi:peptide/nickel transport system permease protein
VSASEILLGGAVGTLAGIVAGYAGGVVDTIIMRLADATLAFPVIFIGLLLAITVGASPMTVITAISLILWARFARVARGEVLALRNRDYVTLARMGGCSWQRIIRRHLLPNIANTLLVVASLQMGLVIIIESSLSFLGAGVPPPSPTWGAMVADGRSEIMGAWWISFFPGVAILVTVLAANLFGDWLRDVLDPKLRQI